MPLITRLDSRSDENSTLSIKDEQDCIIAVIACKSGKTELSVTTVSGLYIEKPNGFSSKKE